MEEMIAASENLSIREMPKALRLNNDTGEPRCKTCGKLFNRRSDLRRHENIHIGRSHRCHFPHCGKQFTQRQTLIIHLRVHTGEKPHKCERCGRDFADSSALSKHRRSHSGAKSHWCPYKSCQKGFTRKWGLTQHMRLQHQEQEGTMQVAAASEIHAPVDLMHLC